MDSWCLISLLSLGVQEGRVAHPLVLCLFLFGTRSVWVPHPSRFSKGALTGCRGSPWDLTCFCFRSDHGDSNPCFTRPDSPRARRSILGFIKRNSMKYGERTLRTARRMRHPHFRSHARTKMKSNQNERVRHPSLYHHARCVLVVCALEVFYFAMIEVPHARGDFFDHVVIVRHEEKRAFVALQRDVQRVD